MWKKRKNERKENVQREQESSLFLFLAAIERQGDCEQGMNTVREDVFKLSNKGALKKATR